MTVEEKIALIILLFALIGICAIIALLTGLVIFLFIINKYKITITKKTKTTPNKRQNAKIYQFKYKSNTDKYYESTYFKQKRITYTEVVNDLGKYGEYLIYDYLKEYQNSGGKFLFNCYLPKDNNQTTEIDVILLHPHGIFVFESKNYSGWIFGNDVSDYWTQTLPVKKGEAHKERFYNPVKQNNLHIECLRKIIGNEVPIYSIIAFSERCTLKEIDVKQPNVYIINRNYINVIISGIMINNGEYLNEEEINKLYEKLYPYTQVSEEVKKQHIDNLHQNIMNNPL